MDESDYKFLCYHYLDLNVLLIIRDVKLRHSGVRLTQINNKMVLEFKAIKYSSSISVDFAMFACGA